MNDILFYFIKSGIAMALFYGIYRIFMEKDTNHRLNRFYLVGTMMLSLVLPILHLETLVTVEQPVRMPVLISLDDQGIVQPVIGVSNATGDGFRLNGFTLARWVYFSGVIILISALIVQSLRLLFIIKRSGKAGYGALKVFFVNRDIAPFSIFNRVFLSKESRNDPKLNTILDHEYAHYRYLHYIDLVFFEFITIFQWFNPFVWLYIRSLKEIHEYQADAAVLRKGEGTGSYQALLVNQLTGTEVFRLANGFSKSLTKKRMIMMTKLRSKKRAWLKSLLAMPVVAVLLIAYAANSNSLPEDDPVIIRGQVVEAGSGEPMPGVAVIWKGHTTGTVTNLNGDFELELTDKEAVLVYSFVGFETTNSRGLGPHHIEMKEGVIPINMEGVSSSDEAIKREEQRQKEEQKQWELQQKEIQMKGEAFWVVEDLARFPGGKPALKRYLEDNIRYPDDARKGKAEVLVQFTIKANGSVDDVRIPKAGIKEMDKEAVRLIAEMPDWIPGKQRGKPVSSTYIVSVVFEKTFGI
jgi:TonB family protein